MDALPADLKLRILLSTLNTPQSRPYLTVCSMISLSCASRSFRSVYTSHQSQLLVQALTSFFPRDYGPLAPRILLTLVFTPALSTPVWTKSTHLGNTAASPPRLISTTIDTSSLKRALQLAVKVLPYIEYVLAGITAYIKHHQGPKNKFFTTFPTNLLITNSNIAGYYAVPLLLELLHSRLCLHVRTVSKKECKKEREARKFCDYYLNKTLDRWFEQYLRAVEMEDGPVGVLKRVEGCIGFREWADVRRVEGMRESQRLEEGVLNWDE